MKKKIFIILFILASIFLVYLFVSFRVFKVSGTSMNPSFNNGESIVVNKLYYSFKEPKRGDIVLVDENNQKLLKRVVGISSEIISIKDCGVYINENKMKEYYIKGDCTFGNQNVSLGKNQYYVLGDNREPNQSTDSRIYGPIPKSKILGKVIYKWDGGLKSFEKGNYVFGQ
ncbi:signal peptidase I [bacterium]|nr:signal peptidase I [bacterium]